MSDFWLGVTVGPAFGLGVALPFLAYRAWGWLKNEFYFRRALRQQCCASCDSPTKGHKTP